MASQVGNTTTNNSTITEDQRVLNQNVASSLDISSTNSRTEFLDKIVNAPVKASKGRILKNISIQIMQNYINSGKVKDIGKGKYMFMNLSEGHPLYGKTMTLDALQRIILRSPAFRADINKMLDYIIEKRKIRNRINRLQQEQATIQQTIVQQQKIAAEKNAEAIKAQERMIDKIDDLEKDAGIKAYEIAAQKISTISGQRVNFVRQQQSTLSDLYKSSVDRQIAIQTNQQARTLATTNMTLTQIQNANREMNESLRLQMLTNTLNNGFGSINTSIGSLNTNLQNGLGSLNTNITNGFGTLNRGLNQVNTDINRNLNQINTDITNGFGTLNRGLNQVNTDINRNLNQINTDINRNATNIIKNADDIYRKQQQQQQQQHEEIVNIQNEQTEILRDIKHAIDNFTKKLTEIGTKLDENLMPENGQPSRDCMQKKGAACVNKFDWIFHGPTAGNGPNHPSEWAPYYFWQCSGGGHLLSYPNCETWWYHDYFPNGPRNPKRDMRNGRMLVPPGTACGNGSSGQAPIFQKNGLQELLQDCNTWQDWTFSTPIHRI